MRATKIGGSISSIDISPHSKNVPVTLTSGQAVLTLNQNSKVWITINGDDANPLFIFADAPKPSVPPCHLFRSGRGNDPGDGNHYRPTNNEVIYLDGGAWVRGNIDVSGTETSESWARVCSRGSLEGGGPAEPPL